VIVDTTGGRVRGTARDGIAAFRGIPYADPRNEFRFRAPGPAPRWDGVRNAVHFGPTAPQASGGIPGIDLTSVLGEWVRGDEYLTVNVWAPESGPSGLPVMVFLHGGAFVAGAGSLALYDGSRFAARGVVLVTVNYRLGVEGFLPLPGGDTNVGLRDQIAALRWVRDNAAAFGGDPDQVTVFGESAGAISIACLLGTKGLFRRAIMQSGNTLTRSVEYGRRLAAALAGQLGIEPTRSEFALKDPADLLAGQRTVARNPRLINLDGLSENPATVALAQFGPVIDGDVVTGAAADPGVDLLAGTNTDEMALWLVPAGQPNSPAMTDAVFRQPTLDLLDRHPGRAFGYEFTWPSPAFEGRLGACHALELPYVFGNLHVPGIEALLGSAPSAELSAKLSDLMQRSWVRFAREGDPGWPQDTIMRIGSEGQ
jgi:para-nitrobenzyl esterase